MYASALISRLDSLMVWSDISEHELFKRLEIDSAEELLSENQIAMKRLKNGIDEVKTFIGELAELSTRQNLRRPEPQETDHEQEEPGGKHDFQPQEGTERVRKLLRKDREDPQLLVPHRSPRRPPAHQDRQAGAQGHQGQRNLGPRRPRRSTNF